MLGNLAKAGVAVGGLGLIEACTKSTGFIQKNIVSDNSNNATSAQAKIVIVGAGMAGLNCAYQLKKVWLYIYYI